MPEIWASLQWSCERELGASMRPALIECTRKCLQVRRQSAIAADVSKVFNEAGTDQCPENIELVPAKLRI